MAGERAADEEAGDVRPESGEVGVMRSEAGGSGAGAGGIFSSSVSSRFFGSSSG